MVEAGRSPYSRHPCRDFAIATRCSERSETGLRELNRIAVQPISGGYGTL